MDDPQNMKREGFILGYDKQTEGLEIGVKGMTPLEIKELFCDVIMQIEEGVALNIAEKNKSFPYIGKPINE